MLLLSKEIPKTSDSVLRVLYKLQFSLVANILSQSLHDQNATQDEKVRNAPFLPHEMTPHKQSVVLHLHLQYTLHSLPIIVAFYEFASKPR